MNELSYRIPFAIPASQQKAGTKTFDVGYYFTRGESQSPCATSISMLFVMLEGVFEVKYYVMGESPVS